MNTSVNTGLTLVSGPYRSRPGLVPMIVALLVGFSFSAVWLTVSACLVCQGGNFDHVVWGVLTGLCTVLYCCYMGIVAYRLFADSKRQYMLELTDSEAILTVVDSRSKKKYTKMVLLDDVKYGEYYPYPDSSSIILHAPYVVMEIPLWPLGARGRDVLDFLAGRGVPVVNVQFDDKVPD